MNWDFLFEQNMNEATPSRRSVNKLFTSEVLTNWIECGTMYTVKENNLKLLKGM